MYRPPSNPEMDLYTFHFGLRIRVVRAVPDLRADPVSPAVKHASRTREDVFCIAYAGN